MGLSLPGNVTQPGMNLYYDCDNAAIWMPFATVNCYYFTNYPPGGKRLLDYTIQVSGTSQEQDGWCQGIRWRIKDRCFLKDYDLRQVSCSHDDEQTKAWAFNYYTGEEKLFYGINLELFITGYATQPYYKKCITDAIRSATCGTVQLDDYFCYEMGQF
ncbi:hypothetical protein F5B20DRAFT_584477 [Whalleya microplaca]|nr:hypothetical protein F5B20DRAFT_584477 [Whalleya microplaca]